MSTQHSMPDGFLWGAATSAYQIEGSPLADGAGPSIWHRFAHTPGRTLRGMHADVACDHYRRWPGDVELMRRLGLRSYRFSIAWGRLLPEGRGRVNRAGIDFYSRLLDALRDAGIRPMVTLYHWDLPAALDDRGGWLNPDIADWFSEYADLCYREFGDRVDLWSTINEPWVIVDAGYLHGVNAPGHANLYEAPIAAHHVLRAHAAAVRTFRASGRKGEIGLVVNLAPHHPRTTSSADVDAARRAHSYFNEQFLDPALLGRTGSELPAIFGDAWPGWSDAEVAALREPIDFLGINWYTRNDVVHDDAMPPVRARIVPGDGERTMTTGWQVRPDGLTETLLWVTERYGRIPIYVTENGATFADPEHAEGGMLIDPERRDYLRSHIAATREAIARGADVRGYFVWSLLDNFEWAGGYSHRFGLIHVNYADQQRTIKASGEFYRDVIATNGAAAV